MGKISGKVAFQRQRQNGSRNPSRIRQQTGQDLGTRSGKSEAGIDWHALDRSANFFAHRRGGDFAKSNDGITTALSFSERIRRQPTGSPDRSERWNAVLLPRQGAHCHGQLREQWAISGSTSHGFCGIVDTVRQREIHLPRHFVVTLLRRQ